VVAESGALTMEHNGAFIDNVQTAGIVFSVILLTYVVVRLEMVLTAASNKLRSALTHQKETHDSINYIWKRINEIETRVGMKSDHFIPADELRTTLTMLQRRLDDIEGAKRW
jgi:hypothetical protein